MGNDVCIVRCMEMRTNIVLDDKLVKKASKLSRAKTKKELVAAREKRDLRELRGKIGFRQDYDYKALRKGRHGSSR
jgi:Arc/MetJ family transcription regulator